MCFHAERSNSGLPFGHPFFLKIYASDTVKDIKNRIQQKLNVPPSEYSFLFVQD